MTTCLSDKKQGRIKNNEEHSDSKTYKKDIDSEAANSKDTTKNTISSLIINDSRHSADYKASEGRAYFGRMYSFIDGYVVTDNVSAYKFDADKKKLVKVYTLNHKDRCKILIDSYFISGNHMKTVILSAGKFMYDLASRINIPSDSYFFNGVTNFAVVIIKTNDFSGECLVLKENISLLSTSKADSIITQDN